MTALYHAGRAFAFGYFFALGLLALTHLFTNWPETYDDAATFALLAGAGALVTHLVLRRRSPPARREPS
jgi:hypothetical protein